MGQYIGGRTVHTNSFTPGTMLRAVRDGHFLDGVFVVTRRGLQEKISGNPATAPDSATLVKVGDEPQYADGGERVFYDLLAQGV